ncbi:MAG: hypothetical protein HYZ65_01010 [Burkholderiales bacterium]|nr:hypothetical protein [Burkholderiales bacterium]
MPSETTPKQNPFPLTKDEAELLQHYRASVVEVQRMILPLTRKMAKSHPANAVCEQDAVALQSAAALPDALNDLRKIGFDIEHSQFEMPIFLDAILDKVEQFQDLSEHDKAIVNAICCFAGCAANKASETRANNALMLDIIHDALQGEDHV